ncbi:MAG: fumarylacetoacetate hydrolase family protein, partial [Psychrobacter sp.]|nr:fumarylacetoacetate hydrolase family protein [Psychrobacter sp.]
MSQSPHMSLADAIAAGVNDNSANDANERLRASIGKVVCVGRNYAAHAEELGNEVPKAPILFMKPASSVVSIRQGVVRPNPALYGETHYEAELCVQLAADLSAATIEEAKQAIGGVTLGLDLTLRELQAELKEKGHPWERAKCFDGACVLGDWLDPKVFGD